MVYVARGNQTESGRGALPTPTKHTPGPWIATPYLEEDEAPGFSIITTIEGHDAPTNGQVAFVTTEVGAAFDDVPIARANAQLIAAAPQLLIAAKRALNVLRGARAGNVVGALAAAIAEATGQ